MSLTYDLSGVKDWETVCVTKGEGQKPKTYAMIMMSMRCGYGEFTEKNYVDIFERIQIYETMMGVFCQIGEVKMPITLADVKAHIGMRINVRPTTKTAFEKDLMQSMWRDAKEASRRQLEEMSK